MDSSEEEEQEIAAQHAWDYEVDEPRLQPTDFMFSFPKFLRFLMVSLTPLSSVAEPHHFYAVPGPGQKC
jgi:hypothetical protein